MKTNIKMLVTPEQSEAVQKIVIANGGQWVNGHTEIKYLSMPAIRIDHNKEIASFLSDSFFEESTHFEEVDADLFIRTNGTCKEPGLLLLNQITMKPLRF